MNNKKLTIALVIPSLKSGGMERVMSELANYFIQLENNCINLVLFGKSPEVFYDLDPKIIIHQPKTKFNNNRIVGALNRMIFLRKTIKKIKPDTVLSFGTLWNSFVLLALKGLKYPVYVSDRGNPTLKYSFIHELMRLKLYPGAEGIITQTTFAKEINRSRFPKANITVIGNPIRKINSSDPKNVRENIVVCVSPLKSTKHHDRLIRIFSKIKGPDWKLVIVGGNSLNENIFDKLQLLVKELSIEDRVHLAGQQKDVDSFYLKSKIFAFTSSTEGFPNVVGEALSAGLPVISYDCITGPSEMIEDGENGYLVPVFDDELFSSKLQDLIDDEKLRKLLGENGKKSMANFNIKKIGTQTLNFILPN